MNMLRGALTFLIVVALFVIVECKKTQNESAPPPTVAGQTTAAAPLQAQTDTGLGARTITCADASPNDAICGSDPCEVEVDLGGGDKPKKVWVDKYQTIKWVGKNGGNSNNLIKVHFGKNSDGTGGRKSGDKLLSPAGCSSGDCQKTMTDATPCVEYKYWVHSESRPPIDPDVEVGSATGTTTSGTAAQH